MDELERMRKEWFATHTYSVILSPPYHWQTGEPEEIVASGMHWDEATKMERLLTTARNACTARPLAESWGSHIFYRELEQSQHHRDRLAGTGKFKKRRKRNDKPRIAQQPCVESASDIHRKPEALLSSAGHQSTTLPKLWDETEQV